MMTSADENAMTTALSSAELQEGICVISVWGELKVAKPWGDATASMRRQPALPPRDIKP